MSSEELQLPVTLESLRPCSIIISDIDGTIYSGFVMQDAIPYLHNIGAQIDLRSWEIVLNKYKSGDPNGKQEVLEYFGNRIQGFTIPQLTDCLSSMLLANIQKFNPKVIKFLQEQTISGGEIYLATASDSSVAAAVAKVLFEQFGIVVSNYHAHRFNLNTSNQIQSVLGPNLEPTYTSKISDKGLFINQIIDRLKNSNTRDVPVYVLGDHPDDLSMMIPAASELNASIICVNPHPKLNTEAKLRGWTILE